MSDASFNAARKALLDAAEMFEWEADQLDRQSYAPGDFARGVRAAARALRERASDV